MRKTTCGAVLSVFLIGACGGEGETVPPPQAPPPPAPVAVAPPPPPAAPPPAPEPPKPSLLELQKESAQAALAALNGHDAKKFADTYASDAVLVEPGLGESKGREAIASDIQKFFDGFPDFKLQASKVYAKGDVNVVEWVVTGTHKGEFQGIKATNKPIGVHGVSVLWFAPDGLVKQDHRYLDVGTVLSQIGQVKAPARAVAALPSGEPEWILAKGTPEEDKQVETIKGVLTSFEKKSEADFLGPLADNVTWADFSAPKDSSGKAEAKKFFQTFGKAFTDVKQSYDTIFAAGDYVVGESSFNGVHSGPLGPLKPTKKPVSLHAVDVIVVKDGKVQHGTTYANSFELLGQEGLLPKPKQAKAEGEKKPASDKPAAEKKPSEKPADKPAADKPKVDAAKTEKK